MRRIVAPIAFAVGATVMSLPAAAQELGYSTSQPLQLPRDTFFGMAALRYRPVQAIAGLALGLT